jgi:Zn-dependent protease
MNIAEIIIFALPSIMCAFIFHEMAHAWMAYSLGDPTAKYEGRLTLNPLNHIDPVGALVLIISLVTSGGRVCFGWAKPVPFDPRYLRNPHRDSLLIALAGPGSNIIMAAVIGLLFFKFQLLPLNGFLANFLLLFVVVNIGFGIFNLIPIPPLDGWKVLQGLLPKEIAYKLMEFEYRFNPMMLIMFIFVIVWFISPVLGFINGHLLRWFTGV